VYVFPAPDFEKKKKSGIVKRHSSRMYVGTCLTVGKHANVVAIQRRLYLHTRGEGENTKSTHIQIDRSIERECNYEARDLVEDLRLRRLQTKRSIELERPLHNERLSLSLNHSHPILNDSRTRICLYYLLDFVGAANVRLLARLSRCMFSSD
jgi:hypothetical protein